MDGMKDQFEVQKWFVKNVNDLERRLKNVRLQQEELLQVKQQEITDFKQTMEQQIKKMLDKRNVLSSFDYDQSEQQLQVELQSKNDQIKTFKSEIEKVRSNNFNNQEKLLRQGMLLKKHQATIANYTNQLSQIRIIKFK